jgi:hypothetical protein
MMHKSKQELVDIFKGLAEQNDGKGMVFMLDQFDGAEKFFADLANLISVAHWRMIVAGSVCEMRERAAG